MSWGQGGQYPSLHRAMAGQGLCPVCESSGGRSLHPPAVLTWGTASATYCWRSEKCWSPAPPRDGLEPLTGCPGRGSAASWGTLTQKGASVPLGGGGGGGRLEQRKQFRVSVALAVPPKIQCNFSNKFPSFAMCP